MKARGILVAITLEMRSLLPLFVMLAGCHPLSLRNRAHALGAKAEHVGAAAMHLVVKVEPVVPPALRAQVQGQLTAEIKARASAHIANAVASRRVAARPDETPVAEQPTTAPVVRDDSPPAEIPMHAQRTVAAPLEFEARWKEPSGERCQAYPSIAQCNDACSAMMKQATWQNLGGQKFAGCGCTQDVPCK